MLVQRLQLPPGCKAPTHPFLLIKRLLKTKLNVLYADPSFLLSFPPLSAQGLWKMQTPQASESMLIML